MSKKDVDKYYTQVCADYKLMKETLQDMEEEFNSSLQDLDRIEQLKKMIEPVKTNYERISYIMYLFNKPNKKQKRFSYEFQNKKVLKKYEDSSLEKIHQENLTVIDNMKNH